MKLHMCMYQFRKDKMVDVKPTVSITLLTANELNNQIKMMRLLGYKNK